jgi:hypothetical protein
MSSYASMIHGKAYDLLVAGFGATFTSYRKTPMLQVQPTDLPVLGIYILRERREQDGQANQGEPHFKHTLTMGFSGGVHVRTDNQNELNALEETMSALDELLLTDPRFVNLTEGITSMDRISQYAKIGETTLFEIRVEMTMEWSSRWEPVITDDFNTLHVESRYPSPTTDPAEVQQVVAQYDIPQNAKRKPN